MEPSGESASKGGRTDTSGTDMAITTIVSQTTGTSGCYTSGHRTPRGIIWVGRISISVPSRVAYLWQHHTSQQLW